MAKAALKSKSKAKPAKKKVAKRVRVGGAPQRPVKLQSARKEQASRFKRVGAAQLSIQGGAPVEFPIYKAVEGANVIDISKLYASTGHFTFDPGFLSTASCDSEITYIDGDKGILRYRGYDIADLASKSNYLETAYLLNYGDLPNAEQKTWFEHTITRHTMVHEQLHFLYRGFPRRAHPMAIMVGAVASLSASLGVSSAKMRATTRLTFASKIATGWW
jgi:citrate synthase